MLGKPHSIRWLGLVLALIFCFGLAAGRMLPTLAPERAASAAAPQVQPLPPADQVGPLDHSAPAASETGSDSPGLAPPPIASYYKTYSGTAFLPHGTSASTTAYAGGGGVYRTAGSNELCCLLDLPSGARVTEVIFYCRDNSAQTINLWFATYDPSVAQYANIASTNSSGVQSAAIVTRSLTGSPLTTIDNSRYQYLLEVGLNETTSAHVIYGARVGYVLPTVMVPLAQKNAN